MDVLRIFSHFLHPRPNPQLPKPSIILHGLYPIFTWISWTLPQHLSRLDPIRYTFRSWNIAVALSFAILKHPQPASCALSPLPHNLEARSYPSNTSDFYHGCYLRVARYARHLKSWLKPCEITQLWMEYYHTHKQTYTYTYTYIYTARLVGLWTTNINWDAHPSVPYHERHHFPHHPFIFQSTFNIFSHHVPICSALCWRYDLPLGWVNRI